MKNLQWNKITWSTPHYSHLTKQTSCICFIYAACRQWLMWVNVDRTTREWGWGRWRTLCGWAVESHPEGCGSGAGVCIWGCIWSSGEEPHRLPAAALRWSGSPPEPSGPSDCLGAAPNIYLNKDTQTKHGKISEGVSWSNMFFSLLIKPTTWVWGGTICSPINGAKGERFEKLFVQYHLLPLIAQKPIKL